MPLAETLADQNQISLVARDDARNIARSYWVERSPDLFGYTVVEWHWGRIGTAGQSRKASFELAEQADAWVRQLLRRRDSAPRRIGISYVVQV